MKTFVWWVIGIALVLAVGFYAFNRYVYREKQDIDRIGGERDEHGCLTPAGYAWSEEVGACIRAFEMTSDIKEAARRAVEHVGRGYALTVVSFNSYEEAGFYDITFEKGEERTRETVYLRDDKVVMRKEAVFSCADGKSITAIFYVGSDKYVDLSLSDGRTISVPRAISASGVRYATADESFVFWNKGDTAFITEKGVTTFTDCVLKEE